MSIYLREDIFLAAHCRYFFEKGKLPVIEEDNRLANSDRTFKFFPDNTKVKDLFKWLSRLAEEGATDLYLIPWQEWKKEDIVPSGQPTALGIVGKNPAVWAASWFFSPETNSWKIKYCRENGSPKWEKQSFVLVKQEVDKILSDLVSFCSPSNEEWLRLWGKKFSEALDDNQIGLGESRMDLDFGPIIQSPNGLLLKKVNMLGVFTGMGSWVDNCIGGEEGKIKDHLTRQLYKAVINAACTAVNTWEIS